MQQLSLPADHSVALPRELRFASIAAASPIHTGLVLGPENRWDLIALLNSSPRLRFDRRNLRPLKPDGAPLVKNILH
jgi:hypothetical protein